MPLLRKPIKNLSQTQNGYKRPYNDEKDKIRDIIDNKLNEPPTKKAYNAFVERLSREKFENRSSSPKMMNLRKEEYKENLDKTNITRKKGERTYTKKLSFNTDESLSQEVLNKKEIKTAYIEFMNHSVAKDKAKKKSIFISNSSEELFENIKKNVEDGKSNKDLPTKMPTKNNKETQTKSIARKKANNAKNLEQVAESEDDEYAGLSLEEKMNRIYERRNVGLYVLCDSCNKARYLPHIVDPLDLPEKWYCHMNPDKKHNKCTDREHIEEDPEFLIDNLYNAGSIVFAKLDGFPWWPAMVEDDIDTDTYFWLDDGSMNPSWYHITFFDSAEVTRAWTKTEKLLAFKKNYKNPKMQLPKKHKYRSRMNAATAQALDALGMPLIERLKKYGFIKRYRKPQRKHTKNAKKQNLNKKKKSLSPIDEDAMSAILDNLSISDLSLNFF